MLAFWENVKRIIFKLYTCEFIIGFLIRGRNCLPIARAHKFTPTPDSGGVRAAHIFSFLCFVFLRPVSCGPNVASVSVFSIHDYIPFFGFR
jgi:hypothetical protein